MLPDGAGQNFEASGTGIALPGTILETIYRGEAATIRVDLGLGQSVLLRSPTKGALGRDGAPVTVGWTVEDMVLLTP
jgi:TOBE domain